MADQRPSRLLRFWPWSKEQPAPETAAVAVAEPSKNGHGPEERKGDIGWFGDLSAGRVVYLGSGVPGDVSEVSRETAYAAAAYIYAAIRYRAENVAEPALGIIAETDDGEEWLTDHAVLELLDEPSPDYDLGELIELTQTYWDLGGDALWVKDENLAGSTGRLTPFQWDEYDVHQTNGRILGRFTVKTARGPKPFDPEDVVYFRYPNPSNRQRGLSPTDVALHWLNLGKRTTATIRSLLQNAMFPSVVITTHPEWSPDEQEFQRFKDLIDQYHSGPQNAGKPFVTLGGGRVERVSFTLQELVPEQLLDRVETIVSTCFRIPPIVLGHLVGLKNSPWSQMEQAHRQAYSDCIIPLWRRWEKALTRQLLRPVDKDPKHLMRFDTSKIAALQEDESKKITDAVSARHWTVNERRIHSGQDPLEDGDERGDFIELTDAVQFPSFPSLGGDEEEDVELGLRRRHVVKRRKDDEEDARTKAWEVFDLLAKAQEAAWESGVYAELKADRAALIAETRGADFVRAWEDAVARASSMPPAIADIETKAPPTGDPGTIRALIKLLERALDIDRWSGRMSDLIASTAKTAVRQVAAQLDIAFDVMEPSLLEYTREEAAWLVRNIDTTTRDRIAAELKAGLAEGDTVSGLRTRIEESVGFSRQRAELVARTESTRVTNGAQRRALSDYQLQAPTQVVEKSWLSARDARVRDEHVDLDDGSWVGVDDTFANGLQAPGEPNCRCTLLYRTREA